MYFLDFISKTISLNRMIRMFFNLVRFYDNFGNSISVCMRIRIMLRRIKGVYVNVFFEKPITTP